MTRAPRSRKKKAAAAVEAAVTAPVEPMVVADSATLSLELDAPRQEQDVVSSPDNDIVARDDASQVDVRTAKTAAKPETTPDVPNLAVEAVPLDAPAPATVDRGSMRIDVIEDCTSIGMRLRAGRERRGWSREDVAHRLHVPASVVSDIECERFERMGALIYVRGYLNKYAQLIELPSVIVSKALSGMEEPQLQVSTDIPRFAATWERYRVAVIGAVITLAVAIPVLTLVAQRGINAPVPQVRSLDESDLALPTAEGSKPPLVSTLAADVVAGSGFESATNPTVLPEVPMPEQSSTTGVNESGRAPMLASISGFVPANDAGAHVLEAQFREDSWIEIFDAEGRVIEQNLVRAGQSRRVVSIKIGNVGGVDVLADGNPIDLTPYARSNVARLRLFEPIQATPEP